MGLLLGAEDDAHADRAALGDDLEAAVAEARQILSKRRSVRHLGRLSVVLLRLGRLDERRPGRQHRLAAVWGRSGPLCGVVVVTARTVVGIGANRARVDRLLNDLERLGQELDTAITTRRALDVIAFDFPRTLAQLRAAVGMMPVEVRAGCSHRGRATSRRAFPTGAGAISSAGAMIACKLHTLVQVEPHRVSDLELTRRWLEGDDPEKIDLSAIEAMARWADRSGVRARVRSTDALRHERRCIGVVQAGDGTQSTHCLVLDGGTVLFDPAQRLPGEDLAGGWSFDDVDYGISCERS